MKIKKAAKLKLSSVKKQNKIQTPSVKTAKKNVEKAEKKFGSAKDALETAKKFEKETAKKSKTTTKKKGK